MLRSHAVFALVILMSSFFACEKDHTTQDNNSNNTNNANNNSDGGLDGDVEDPSVYAPGDFAGAWGNGGYTLSWLDTNPSEVTYTIEKSTGDSSPFTSLTEVSGDATSFTDRDISSGDTATTYRIRAVLGALESEWVECETALKAWTYVRIVGYDSLWGEEGPSMAELISGHLTYDMASLKGSDNINLVLLGDSYGDEGCIYAFIDPVQGVVIEDQPECNTGDVNTYRDFFDWVMERFSARKYAISYWSHGGGSIPFETKKHHKSIGFDDTNGDELTADETGQVLSYLKGLTGRPIDLMFSCACLTSMVGNIYPLRDTLLYLVAGESVVGCNSDVLDVLRYVPWWSSEEIAVQNNQSQRSTWAKDVVYAATDVRSAGDLATLLDTLVLALMDYGTPGAVQRGRLRDAAQTAQNMGYQQGPEYNDCYIDLYDYALALHELGDHAISEAANGLLDFLDSTLIVDLLIQNDDQGFYGDAHGISIYHPLDSYYSYYYFDSYDTLSFSADTSWDEYLRFLAH